MTGARRGRLRQAGVWFLAISAIGVLTLLVLEAELRAYYWFTRGTASTSWILDGQFGGHDPDLGFALTPNAVAHHWGTEFDTQVRINGQGLRMDREVPLERTPGVRRLLLVGDSMTFGHGVNTEERFGEKLEGLVNDLEVVNFGVPGTGTDQQYLLYARDGVDFDADLVVLCYLTENIRRNAIDARVMAGGESLRPKPQFVLRDGELVLTNVPVPDVVLPLDEEYRRLRAERSTKLPIPFIETLRKHSQLYAFLRARLGPQMHSALKSRLTIFPEYDEARPEWQVTRAIIRRFARECRDHGSEFALVVFPTVNEVKQRNVSDRPNRMIREMCDEEGIPVLDLLPGFREAQGSGPDLYYALDHHWTPEGHTVAARLMAGFLESQLPEK